MRKLDVTGNLSQSFPGSFGRTLFFLLLTHFQHHVKHRESLFSSDSIAYVTFASKGSIFFIAVKELALVSPKDFVVVTSWFDNLTNRGNCLLNTKSIGLKYYEQTFLVWTLPTQLSLSISVRPVNQKNKHLTHRLCNFEYPIKLLDFAIKST